MDKPTPAALREAVPISQSYASMILDNDGRHARTPARNLAIEIFRKTGWKHPVIADLTDEQMAVIEQVDPWQPRKSAEAGQDLAA